MKAAVKNLYEAMIVIKPNLNEDGLDKCVEQIQSSIKNYGGSIVQIDEPSKKRLTHKIKGFKEGNYLLVVFSSPSEVPNLLKRSLSISDDVVRHIIVKKENKK